LFVQRRLSAFVRLLERRLANLAPDLQDYRIDRPVP
jgi:hypothetical protein